MEGVWGDVRKCNRREDSAGWGAQESCYRGGDRQLHRVVRLYDLRLPGGRDRTALLPGGEPSSLAHGDLRGLRGGVRDAPHRRASLRQHRRQDRTPQHPRSHHPHNVGATFFIGLVPSYESIGILAPLLLVLARVVQGFAVGGEYGGATSFIVEYAPEDKRGLYGSWQFVTQGASLMVGLLIVTVLTTVLSEEALFSWAWRVPFLVALPLGLIGLYMRLKLEDTPAFEAVREHHEVERTPLKESLRHHGKDLLKVIGLTWLLTGLTYLLVFMPTYLSEELDVPLASAYTAVILGTAAYCVTVLVAALLSDRIGRRKPFLLAAPVVAVFAAVPIFLLIQTANFAAITLALVIVGVILGSSAGVYAAATCEVFPTNVRYSSLSLGYSVAVSIFGGTTPLIFTSLLAATGNPISPAFYLIAAALAGIVAALTFPETAREPLHET